MDLFVCSSNPQGKACSNRLAKDKKRKFINSDLALDTEGKHRTCTGGWLIEAIFISRLLNISQNAICLFPPALCAVKSQLQTTCIIRSFTTCSSSTQIQTEMRVVELKQKKTKWNTRRLLLCSFFWLYACPLSQSFSKISANFRRPGWQKVSVFCACCVKSLALLKLSIVGWMINKRFCV